MQALLAPPRRPERLVGPGDELFDEEPRVRPLPVERVGVEAIAGVRDDDDQRRDLLSLIASSNSKAAAAAAHPAVRVLEQPVQEEDDRVALLGVRRRPCSRAAGRPRTGRLSEQLALDLPVLDGSRRARGPRKAGRVARAAGMLAPAPQAPTRSTNDEATAKMGRFMRVLVRGREAGIVTDGPMPVRTRAVVRSFPPKCGMTTFDETRREFLRAATSAAPRAARFSRRNLQRAGIARIPARFVGDAFERGHHWLTPDPEKLHVDQKEKKGVVIVGGGHRRRRRGVAPPWRRASTTSSCSSSRTMPAASRATD